MNANDIKKLLDEEVAKQRTSSSNITHLQNELSIHCQNEGHVWDNILGTWEQKECKGHYEGITDFGGRFIEKPTYVPGGTYRYLLRVCTRCGRKETMPPRLIAISGFADHSAVAKELNEKHPQLRARAAMTHGEIVVFDV